MSSTARWSPPVSFNRSSLTLPVIVISLIMVALVISRLQTVGALIPMFGVIGMCLGVLVVVRPAIGLVALVASAAFLRVTIGTGTDSAIVASLLCAVLLVVGWVAHRLIHQRPVILLSRAIAAPALILCAATLFSFLWGRLSLDPRIEVPATFYRVQIAQASLTLVSVALLFVGADLLRDRSNRNVIVMTILAAGTIALPFRWIEEARETINTAGLFGLWFVALAWANALANTSLRPWMRAGLGFLAVGWLAMAYVREGSWVSGWLPGVIAILVITIIARPKLGVVMTVIAAIATSAYFSILYDVLVTTQKAEGSIGGDFGRMELIQRNLGLIKEHLLVGTGPAGYVLYYITFFPDLAMSTHNNYVDILSQNGIIGLLSFVVLLFALGITALRLVPHVPDPTDRSIAIAIAGAIPGLIFSLWLGDWLIPFVYNQTIAGFDHAVYSWLMLACLCGLYAQYRRKGNADA